LILSLTAHEVSQLGNGLLCWYDARRRNLPWRRDQDPYRVWVSEIMLQQTRVAAVLEHYARWMERFPTVTDLARAREQTVLALWSGLGYYHRARRLHQAAKLIVREREGEFPQTAEGWRELPGIGRYTAAAIASIAFGEHVAVVDGNVERVLDRLFGTHETKEAHWRRAEDLLERSRPGDFNQAMMELGATICTPRSPQCLLCPLVDWCTTRGLEPRKPQPARKRKEVHLAFAQRGGAVLLVQRAADAKRMANMWELPEMPVGTSLRPTAKERQLWATHLGRFRHSITDTDFEVAVLSAPDSLLLKLNGNARWFGRKQWERLPLTGLTRKILRKLAPAT
jgi:A/G-specific adenine glycosylase